ncbi:hypothetical protein [Persicobacter sp. CCB-QB2]|uniref:P-loop ATPase, Sll1717 family n=1 Tax=Persicobacter sp. CCB-QB2 TaxID=1561025 RepID=UPI0006A9D867|nr:hypothetical protein [Persicobacter sp. CCB-QB2]
MKYYIEESYDAFCQYYYDVNSVPSIDDDTADHFPIHIPYNEIVALINDEDKINRIIEDVNSAYYKIADHISYFLRKNSGKELKLSEENEFNDKVLNAMTKSVTNGAAENEFNSDEDLKNRFYPTKSYRYIFDKNSFLVLGEKGSGKTALFTVLKHQNYTKALASYCDADNKNLNDLDWKVGYESETNFTKPFFKIIAGQDLDVIRAFWIALLLKNELTKEIITQKFSHKEFLSKLIDSKQSEWLGFFDNPINLLFLEESIIEYDQLLSEKGTICIFVYDYLDQIHEEESVRGKIISGLISFYFQNIKIYKNIKAKIFLRQDIFDREVNDITDKVKLDNYTNKLSWNFDELLNILWKRMYHADPHLKNTLFYDVSTEFGEIKELGAVPNLNHENHQKILTKIFGERMGGNNKSYPSNWIKNHIQDTNEHIHPRTLLWLIESSAALQKKDRKKLDDRIIRSKNAEDALIEVSRKRVQELKEEYPQLDVIFNLFDGKSERSPMEKEVLKKHIKKAGIPNVDDFVSKMEEIGIIREYFREKNKYQFPDIYLSGLGLVRKGAR